MKKRIVWVLCLLAGLAGARTALATQLTVEEIDTDARTVAIYRCANQPKPVRVAYWLARNGQSFALVPVNDRPMLFVDTVSASGARYQAGRYVWWTKGPAGNLTDEIAGPSAPPLLGDCEEIKSKREPR
ncbi:MliC family protein [Burkholderia plantarii]|uniref:MliC family protein n=1 Tax=Burkholderia plantarii TaxID=41899 RepID=UPI0018DDECE9|nr:MliC family protein [Burkholderia plantarii]MBI0327720.1 MliC family protein [Burkholderia plantarii]